MVICGFVFVILLTSGIICDDDITGDVTSEDDLTTIINFGTTSIVTDEDVSIKTSYTDVDTNGDIVITSKPTANHTEKETTNATDTDVTDDVTISTVIDISTPFEIITFPDEYNNSACISNPCLNNGTCHEEPNSQYFYKCNCTHGYAGTHCQVTDKCVTHENGKVCYKGACAYEKDGLTRFCECYLETFWDEAKKECRASSSPCFPNPCHNNGTCNVEGENYKCDCNPGYEGETCDIANWCPDEDTCDNGQCLLDAEINRKQCVCDAGFYWDEKQWECEDIKPPCYPNPCKNNGTCESSPGDTVNFNCTCKLGFLGPKCEIENLCTLSEDGLETCVHGICEIDDESKQKCKVEMQFSSVSEDNLKRLKLSENCLTVKESTSKCVLPPSLVLQKDFISEIVAYEETDPCDADVKDILCGYDTVCTSSTSEVSFNCTCKAGFEVRSKSFPFGDTESYIESCRDINECAEATACSQNMNCENTIGSYLCSCKPKYRVKDTSNLNSGCVEICDPNPCVHGECSAIGDHEFECRCDAGYSGTLCNLKDENFKRARTNTIVVGAVLGGALLVTLILSYVYISRLKKKKYSDSPDEILYATEMTERRNVDSGTINNAFQREQ